MVKKELEMKVLTKRILLKTPNVLVFQWYTKECSDSSLESKQCKKIIVETRNKYIILVEFWINVTLLITLTKFHKKKPFR